MDLVETAACARENLLKTFSCKKALNEIRQISTPSNGNDRIMTPDAWKAIYESTAYDKGLDAAVENLEKMVKSSPKIFTPETNIFDLLTLSFSANGLSKKDSIEAAWNVLAAISNGGPNTAQRADALKSGKKSTNLSIIANSMGILDYLKQEEGWPLFSYPRNVKSDCDSAKPYHFWMSAYLGRNLARHQNLSRDDIANYVILAEKGYQVNRSLVSGKINSNSFLQRDSFDPSHQVIRMDLAYSAIGAAFGSDSVHPGTTKNYDVNKTLVKLMESSGTNPKDVGVNMTQLENLNAFESVFHPEAAVQVIRNIK